MRRLAHYAKEAFDIEYEFPFGWGELEGIHNRTDFDLKRHSEYSGKKMEYFDEQEKQKYIPYVIETAVGATRSFLAFLVDAYDDEEIPKEDGKSEIRTVLHFHPELAPIKAAIFPLVNKDGMPEIAHEITNDLQKELSKCFMTTRVPWEEGTGGRMSVVPHTVSRLIPGRRRTAQSRYATGIQWNKRELIKITLTSYLKDKLNS